MFTENNHANWLANMKGFCEELDLFLRSHTSILSWVNMPDNKAGIFDKLCSMSTDCTYVSDIDNVKHQAAIIEIQLMARKTLVYMSTHPAMKAYRHTDAVAPFFEKPLFIALALAVEHQDACKNPANMVHMTKTQRIQSV
jgi:hypothetical protein